MEDITKREMHLFRYDLTRPEHNWSEHRHSIEYEYNNVPDIFRFKNQIGAFFFYFNREQAIKTAIAACRKSQKDEFWLTETTLSPGVKLLDLRDRLSQEDHRIELDRPSKIITYLFDSGIDVLTKKFARFEPVGIDSMILTPFSIIRPLFENLNLLLNIHDASEDIIEQRFALANEIDRFFHGNIGFLGQLLTDFTNGQTFKELLTNAGFDGYIFEEERTTHVQTYCLFSADHLSSPQSQHDSVYNYQVN